MNMKMSLDTLLYLWTIGLIAVVIHGCVQKMCEFWAESRAATGLRALSRLEQNVETGRFKFRSRQGRK